MNIANLIDELQHIASQTTDTLALLMLSKSIEKLKVGEINAVNSFGDLPSLPLSTNGNLYLVKDENAVYYNIDESWTTIIPPPGVYSWGNNSNGRLGDGTTTSKSSPVTVIGDILDWKQVSGSIGLYSIGGGGPSYNSHGLGVTESGIAYAWGSNSAYGYGAGTSGTGQLGDGTTVDKSSPVTVIGGITDWVQVSAGGYHSAGLTDSGILYTWGRNTIPPSLFGPPTPTGALGDGTSIDKSSPVTVIGGISNWKQVSAGSDFTVAVTQTGIAHTWGSNDFGKLGDGTTTSKSSPVLVIGGIENWKQVSSGNSHSLGVTQSGIAYAWGRNAYSGRLGDGTTVDKSSPVTVIGGITNWSQVSSGRVHSTGITDGGIIYSWGSNVWGQLGDNSVTSRLSPVTVIGGISNWNQVSAGKYHTVGITDSGIAYSWGRNNLGQLGNGTSGTDTSSPASVIGGITDWTQIVAADSHSLGIST